MDKESVEHLAKLARIAVTDEEAESLAKDMTSILEYVSEIEKITGNKEQEKTVGPRFNVFREDENPHEGGIYSKEILDAVPRRDGDYIKVKKILGDTK